MDLQKRTIVKTVTYRVAALLATIPFTGLTAAFEIHIILMLIYYVHERVWTRIKWAKESL